MITPLHTPDRPTPSPAPLLSLRGVTRTYGDGAGRVTALHPTTLDVRPGELVAIRGPSGSGKSTLLAIAGALLQPTAGQVLIAGEDVTALPGAARPAYRLAHLGFVLQSSNLIAYLTVREQLTLIPHLARRDARAATQQADALLARLGLSDRADHHPDALSGGQRQRVAIARALMNDPQLILADEPTASLDGPREREVVEMLAREVHGRGRAAVMVTHDERVLDLCDRTVHIIDGHVHEA